MPIKVAILGGAFNPPQIGHLDIADIVLRSRAVEQVWFTPCNNHMYNKKMSSSEDRLNMCKLMCRDNPRLKVFDYEIANNLKGDTYGFIEKLLKDNNYSNYEFSLVIGMDNANEFSKWYKYESLEKMIRFLVVSRQGIVRDEKIDWYTKAPHIYIGGGQRIANVSSTEIRNMIANNELKTGLVLPEVEKYIKEHNLYQERV